MRLQNEFETDSVARSMARLHFHLRRFWRNLFSSFDRNNDGRIDILDLADFRRTLSASLQSLGGLLLNVLTSLEAKASSLFRHALGTAACVEAARGCASALCSPRELDAPAAASSLERGRLHTSAAEASLASARAAYLRSAARRRVCAALAPLCLGGARDAADRLLARLDGVGAHLAAAAGPLSAAAAELRAAAARRARRAALWCAASGLHAAAGRRAAAASPVAAAAPLASLAASALAAALSLRRRAALRRQLEAAAAAQRRHDAALAELARLAAAAAEEKDQWGCLG
jgi:hypothetical protein